MQSLGTRSTAGGLPHQRGGGSDLLEAGAQRAPVCVKHGALVPKAFSETLGQGRGLGCTPELTEESRTGIR